MTKGANGESHRQVVLLPRQVEGGSWGTLAAWGITPTGKIKGLFLEAELGPGWALHYSFGPQPDRALGSPTRIDQYTLLDGLGNKRAVYRIGLAHLVLCPRFRLMPRYQLTLNGKDGFRSRVEIVAAERDIVHSTGDIPDRSHGVPGPCPCDFHHQLAHLMTEAEGWADRNIPDWRDPRCWN